MRTTMTIDDATMRELKRLAAREDVPLKEVVNRVLRAGLAALKTPRKGRRRAARTFAMGFPAGGLDHALQIASQLENEEVARKAALRK
jgi:hypothetical protein